MIVDKLFDILERYWGGVWKPSKTRAGKGGDDPTLAGLLSDKEDSAGIEVELHRATTDEYLDADEGSASIEATPAIRSESSGSESCGWDG